MADDKHCCPDCNHKNRPSWEGVHGDGECANCNGKGKIGQFDLMSILPGMDSVNDYTCDECSGTGQCQTCGGTGWEYE